MDLNKIPEYARQILFNYLIPLNPRVPVESLLLTLNIECSKITCFNRVTVEDPNIGITGCPTNIYGITFMPSSAGKDKPLKDLKEALKGTDQILIDRKSQYLKERAAELDLESLTKGGKAQQAKWLSDNKPRTLIDDTSEATMEGLYAMRVEYQRAKIGSFHFSSSEFIDYISSRNNDTRSTFLQTIKEIFDVGDNKAKIIQGNKTAYGVKGVPQTMLVHSSLKGLMKDEMANEKLKSFFDRGFSRRSFIVYPQSTNGYVRRTREDIKKNFSIAASYKPDIDKIFQRVYNSTIDLSSLKLNEEAEDVYFNYKEDCEEKASKFNQVFDEGLISELTGRSWKMIKLAGVIACFQGHREITKEDMEYAIYQTELHGSQFRKFYGREKILDVEKIFHFIVTNQDKKEVTRTDLRKHESAPHPRDGQTRWVTDILTQLQEFCMEKGVVFKELKSRHNKTIFRIEDIPKQEEAPDHQEKDLGKFTISIGHSNNQYENEFIRKEIEFNQLHEATTCGRLYSGCMYENNTRAKPNKWEVGNSLVIMDFDNAGEESLSIDQAKELFKEFKYFIIPSRSHGLNKEGSTNDRYRLIVPFHKPIDFIGDPRYKVIMDGIIDEFNIRKFIDVGALRRAKCYFFTSDMHKDMYWYGEGKKLINWERFDTWTPPVEQVVIPVNSDKKAANVLTDFDFTPYQRLAAGGSEPLKCPYHDDSAASAYVSRSDTGSKNLALFCSSDKCPDGPLGWDK